MIRDGSGSRTRLPSSPGGSLPNETVTSGRDATARTVAAVAVLKASSGS